jgi:hypothetical protein
MTKKEEVSQCFLIKVPIMVKNNIMIKKLVSTFYLRPQLP